MFSSEAEKHDLDNSSLKWNTILLFLSIYFVFFYNSFNRLLKIVKMSHFNWILPSWVLDEKMIIHCNIKSLQSGGKVYFKQGQKSIKPKLLRFQESVKIAQKFCRNFLENIYIYISKLKHNKLQKLNNIMSAALFLVHLASMLDK